MEKGGALDGQSHGGGKGVKSVFWEGGCNAIVAKLGEEKG